MTLSRCGALLLGMLIMAGDVAAQAPTQPSVLSVRAGERVLVTMTDGSQVLGRVWAVAPDGLRLDTPGGTQVIPVDRIARLVVKDSLDNGLLVGLGTGAGAGFSLGMTVNMICAGEGSNCPGAVVLLTAMGAAIGGAVGVGIDGIRQRVVLDRIDGPGELVPEVRAHVAFARSRTSNVKVVGPASAGASWSIRHTTSRWGVELEADRTLRSTTRLFECPDIPLEIEGCGVAREGIQDLTIGSAKVQYFLRQGRVQPYLGGGLMIYQLSQLDADVRTPFRGGGQRFVVEALSRRRSVGVVAEAGARVQITSRLAVLPDITFYRANDIEQWRGSLGVGYRWN